MSAQRVLVTGGSGFIGSALVKALVRHGDAVRVFDDNSRGALRRLRDVDADVEFVAGDIRDPAAVDAAMRGPRPGAAGWAAGHHWATRSGRQVPARRRS